MRYVKNIPELGGPDLIVLPGTKSTMSDLVWLRESGLEATILRKARDGTPVLGICGGYQMLGLSLEDPYGVEMGGQMRGIGLLPVHTVFSPLKERRRVEAYARAPFKSARMEGYEIHMGHTDNSNVAPFCQIKDGSRDGAVKGAVFGTYLHGLFDTGELTIQLAEWLAGRRGLSLPKARVGSYKAFKQEQYNLIADIIRRNLDMNALHHAMRVAQVTTGEWHEIKGPATSLLGKRKRKNLGGCGPGRARSWLWKPGGFCTVSEKMGQAMSWRRYGNLVQKFFGARRLKSLPLR